MAQAKKEGAKKRTFRLSDDLMARMARVAQDEHRTLTAQIEVFLWDKLRQYERERSEKSEGPWMPELLEAA